MVNTLQTIAQEVQAWILTAVAVLERKLIDYATDLERKRLIEKLERAQRDMLEVVTELRELEARDDERHVFHMASECKYPDTCPYYGHNARDEYEQAVHG